MLPSRDLRQRYNFQINDKKSIDIQGWLVKHEQEYMYAISGEDISNVEKLKYIENLVKHCVPEDFDISSLSETEFYRLIIELRKISKGSEHEINFTCPNCNTLNEDKLMDLNEDVYYIPYINTTFSSNNLSINLKDVSKKAVELITKEENEEKRRFLYIVHSVDSIIINDDIYSNLSTDEIKKYLEEEVTPEEFEDLKVHILKNSSSLSVNKIFKCDRCGKDVNIYVDNIFDFFE